MEVFYLEEIQKRRLLWIGFILLGEICRELEETGSGLSRVDLRNRFGLEICSSVEFAEGIESMIKFGGIKETEGKLYPDNIDIGQNQEKSGRHVTIYSIDPLHYSHNPIILLYWNVEH